MKRPLFLLPLIKVAFVFSLITPTISNSAGNEVMTSDEQTILSTVLSMTQAFHSGNIDDVMDTYETSQSIAFEPGQAVSDAKLARQMFQDFSSMQPQFTYSGHEVIVEGDLAIHIAPWTMSGRDPDNNEIEMSGLSVAVLRRQQDGSWKIVIDNPYGSHLLPGRN
ncbi:YybH family protein [Roseibium sediminis]|uniref:YybH family protein n=1 Tax=Roseibium sediminis TaxID=1775174 RepID=UPI00123D7121|nr:DUF4440 domain-containing protein [Roseibium sediminis]